MLPTVYCGVILILVFCADVGCVPTWKVTHADDDTNDSCLQPYQVWGCIDHRCYDIGTQGPCGTDQVFLEIPQSFDRRLLLGGALSLPCAFSYSEQLHQSFNGTLFDPDLNNTRAPVINPNQKYGYCVWNGGNHPCHGLPGNQRYSNETKKCHPAGFQGYCPKNQIFYEQRYFLSGEVYGECDCFPLFEMWYDPKDGNCYPPHSQGSCSDGEWLTIKHEYGPVECEPAPCPADGKHVYWTEGHQQCYLRGERGPCEDSPYGEVLGFPFGLVRCASQRTLGPTIFSRSPRRMCSEVWQTASRMTQVSQDCVQLNEFYKPSTFDKNHSCGEEDAVAVCICGGNLNGFLLTSYSTGTGRVGLFTKLVDRTADRLLLWQFLGTH